MLLCLCKTKKMKPKAFEIKLFEPEDASTTNIRNVGQDLTISSGGVTSQNT
jgi:hypothetical protein